VKRLATHWAFLPLLLALALRLTAIWWGLPASDGWDNDGIAPRDVFPGLVASFTPGEFYTYPPLHLAVLAVLSSPVAIWGALASPSLHVGDVVTTLLAPSYMTWFAAIARVVALVLSLATTWLVADLARRTCGPRAATIAAWAGAVNMGFTYYGKTSNLDVPCIFYATLSIWFLTRDRLVPNGRHKIYAALAAVCAVTTKDQAYANFVLVLPVCAFASLVERSSAPRWQRVRAWALALAAGVGGYAVASTLLFNPRGFFARLAFLRGSASQDFMLYSDDWSGRLAAAEGTLRSLQNLLGAPLLALAAVGVLAVCLQRVVAKRRVARMLPGLAALSFFVFFNCVARRSEERFVLAQSTFLAFYVGVGLAYLDTLLRGQLATPVRFLAPLFLLPALVRSLALDAGLLNDPRHEVERWLAEHHGAKIEAYGNDVYLPRFEAGANVVRISPPESPIQSPLPGVRDVVAAFGDVGERQPDFLIVPHAYSWRYRTRVDRAEHGRVMARGVARAAESSDGGQFFKALFEEELGYRKILQAECDDSVFERVNLHASVCEPVLVFARIAAP